MGTPESSGSDQHPARYDPWSGKGLRGFSWFATSTLLHVGLLLLLGTISLTVIKTAEKINVEVVDVEESDLDAGVASLEDLPGLLDVAPSPRRRASRPAGPRVQNVRAPDIPKLGGVGPKLGRGPAVDTAASSLAFGAGGVGGLGGSFGDYVGGLRRTGLDLALVIDTTESMQFVIDEVKKDLAALVRSLQRMVPTSRVGIVIYRDRGDEYVVKWTDLSFKTAKLEAFLAGVRASGGGDWEEAVFDAVDTAIHELSWRKRSKRIIILVAGSPPHAKDVEPLSRLVREFHQQGGYVSTIDVTMRLHTEFNRALWRSLYGDKPYEPAQVPDFYRQVQQTYASLAADGGGELVELGENRKLLRDILILTFGSRWKIEMAKYLKELS
jgi:hypothetical protein